MTGEYSAMDHLTALDAGFLEAEDSDRHVSLAIGGVSVIEGPMPDFAALTAGIADRVATVPRFRQVLRTHQLDLSPPEWVEDEQFDISHHVHRAALPHPGDDATLFRFVAEVMERRLDRDRPLWECWIVEGVEGGRWALLMKMHHCIADGLATMRILAGLGDDGDGVGYAAKLHTSRETPKSRRWSPTLNLNPVSWMTGMWNLASSAASSAAVVLAGTAEVTSGLLRPAATSSLNGPVSTMRRISSARVALADVWAICDEFDVTVNDVALAAITHSYRAAMIRRGERPERSSLRTLVPVSIRGAGDGAGNRVSLMLPFLPVNKDDPLQQLQAVHRRLSRAKSSGQREAGGAALAAADLLPFPVTAWLVRAVTKLPQRGVVTLATNVPGPRRRMRMMGRDVVRVIPIPPIALQLRTGIAIISYADELVFGITADFDATPDVDDLARGIEDGVARLAALCTGRDDHRDR